MSVRSEIKRVLGGVASLGSRVYSDRRPEGEPLPVAVILDQISLTPDLLGDARVMHWQHATQIDLWEDAAIADEASRDAVVNALDGADIADAFRLRVVSANRVYEPDHHLSHVVITVECRRAR